MTFEVQTGVNAVTLNHMLMGFPESLALLLDRLVATKRTVKTQMSPGTRASSSRLYGLNVMKCDSKKSCRK